MKKIMIIDDNKDLQEIYKLNFEMAGYQVFQEFDGLEGIAVIADKQPDIILLDVMMPNMNGFAFIKALKENTDIKVPIVVCSDRSDKETYDKAISSGAVAFLLKIDYAGKAIVDKITHILNGVDR